MMTTEDPPLMGGLPLRQDLVEVAAGLEQAELIGMLIRQAVVGVELGLVELMGLIQVGIRIGRIPIIPWQAGAGKRTGC